MRALAMSLLTWKAAYAKKWSLCWCRFCFCLGQWALQERPSFFEEVPLMPDEPNRVIQREIYSPTLVKKHGALTGLE